MQVKTLFLSENTPSPLLKNINTFFLHRMLFNKSGKKTAPPGAFPTRRGTSAEDGVSLKQPYQKKTPETCMERNQRHPAGLVCSPRFLLMDFLFNLRCHDDILF